MPHDDGKLVKKFLLELSSTMDIESAMRSCGLTAAKAKSIFKKLAGGIPVQAELFAPAPTVAYEIRVDGACRGNPGHSGAGND